MRKTKKKNGLCLLEEPLFSLAFGEKKEDFQLLWSLLVPELKVEVTEIRSVRKEILDACPVISAYGVDEKGKKRTLSIMLLSLEDHDNLEAFPEYLGDTIRDSMEDKQEAPWFCIIFSMKGRGKELDLLSSGDGERRFRFVSFGDEDDELAFAFGLKTVDVTAPTCGFGWSPLSGDLTESDPARIHTPELRKRLSAFKSAKGKERLATLCSIKAEEETERIRTRLLDLGFSAEETAAMLKESGASS